MDMSEQSDIIHYDVSSYAFCCDTCRCDNPTQLNNNDDNNIEEVLVSQSTGDLYAVVHRKCCHGIIGDYHGQFLSPYGKFMKDDCRIFNKRRKTIQTETKRTLLSKSQLQAAVHQAAIEEKKATNLAVEKDANALRYTDQRYLEFKRKYNEIKEERSKSCKKSAVVLEVFSGIGSGVLALKRLGIAISTLIVVEHDPIAAFVCKSNHEKDVENYCYIEKFEDLVVDIENIVDKYGPIDIIIGGPPCVDFSGVNANRKGVKGKQGGYTPQFGDFIKKVKKCDKQNNHEIFFLCENVSMTSWDDEGIIERSFGISKLEFNANLVSPCKRHRAYFTNIPVNELPLPGDVVAESCVSHVLKKDGWMHPAQISPEANIIYKANTFMASAGRIDDSPRMIKVRENDGKYEVGFYSVTDREVLMGFPRGYVSKAVNQVFTDIVNQFTSEAWADDVLLLNQTSDEDSFVKLNYLKTLSGLGYSFYLNENSIAVKVGVREKKMSGNKNEPKYYFSEEDYGKHLIGNAFSIPAVQHLLQPLKCIFKSKEYNDSLYSFEWPPHQCD